MPSFASVAGEHLAGIGLAPGLLSSFTQNLKADDILGIAIRVALIGLVAAGVRKLLTSLKTAITDTLFPSAYIAATDPAFNWVMAYIAQDQATQSHIKSFRLTTADTRESRRDDAKRNNTYYKKENRLAMSKSEASFTLGSVIGQVVPVNERSVRIRHDKFWLWIMRSDRGFALSPSSKDLDYIQVTGLVFQRDSIKQFLVAAHDAFFKKSDSEILIFHPSPQSGNWYDPISRPSRTWESVVLPDTIKDDLLVDVDGFLSEEEKKWYAARGIPHRRGYLLHGRPGAGKTTLATAIASALKLDIYVVNPAARGMDDGKLNKAFRSCPPGNMILIEDIDCVMSKRRKSGDDNDDDSDDDVDQPEGASVDPGKFGFAKSTVTLSGLLNAIDGVSSQEDCVLFASTNHPNRLDEALSRPGRFDVHIAFFDATHDQALALFKHFYPASELKIPMATEMEKDPQDIIDDLAKTFADDVFCTDNLTDGSQVAISMAALQGYLLGHKKDPRSAANGAKTWVTGESETQEQRLRKRMERAVKNAEIQVTPLTPVSPISSSASP